MWEISDIYTQINYGPSVDHLQFFSSAFSLTSWHNIALKQENIRTIISDKLKCMDWTFTFAYGYLNIVTYCVDVDRNNGINTKSILFESVL